MDNVLVTGGAGYIGSHCCKELYHAGYNPVTIEGDIGNADLLRKCFSDHSVSAVMHFAAYAYVGESVTDPGKYYDNNVKKTINLLNTIVEAGVKNIIFSSSCATYGNPKILPMDETHPQNPINPYGKSKYMVEEILKDFSEAYNLKFTSLRYFNAAGADPDGEVGEDHTPETHIIPLLMEVASGIRKKFCIFGDDYDTVDGTCIRDYIHVTDLAKAHILALKRLNDGGESDFFNLGTERGCSVLEMVDTVEKVTGEKISYTVSERRPGDPPVLIASSEKAKILLGWHPEYSDTLDVVKTAWKWHAKKIR
jgi:UDP-glucose 4-epimerase